MSFLHYSIEADSLDNQLDIVQKELKSKINLLEEKSSLIQELRQQVEDRDRYIEELEGRDELKRRDIDRLTKALNDKEEELEAVSRFSKELETRVDAQSRKLDARTEQLQKLYSELTKAKKDLVLVDELRHKIELLEAQRPAPRALRREDLIEHNEEIAKLKRDLETTENSWQVERQHKERFAMENSRLERKVDELSRKILDLERKIEINRKNDVIMTTNENLRLPMAEEQGEFMNSQPLKTNGNKQNIQREFKSSAALQGLTPLDIQRMRIERAKELDRRNKLTKPLHQTSYPLELDLYDDDDSPMECSKIKPENITRKALSPCPINIYQQQQQQRPRRPVKKAEAFIVN